MAIAHRWNTPPRSGEIKLLGSGGVAFKTVDHMPAFKGNMNQWLKENMQYPDAARAEKAKDGCRMQFTVTENGEIFRPQIVRSSGDAGLDSEAMRMVNKMPNWNPGMHNGQAVPVVVTLAIYFDPSRGDGC